MDRRIKLRHLEAFVEITKARSLKRAAERLNLTQPAISRTLAELEEILGTRLLSRGRGGVELTAQGEVLFDFAQAGLGALERGLDGASDRMRQSAPRLHVGAVLPPDPGLRFHRRCGELALQTILGTKAHHPTGLDQLGE